MNIPPLSHTEIRVVELLERILAHKKKNKSKDISGINIFSAKIHRMQIELAKDEICMGQQSQSILVIMGIAMPFIYKLIDISKCMEYRPKIYGGEMNLHDRTPEQAQEFLAEILMRSGIPHFEKLGRQFAKELKKRPASTFDLAKPSQSKKQYLLSLDPRSLNA